MTSTRFCLVRYGETDWNAEKRLQGQADIGLNATGRAMRAGLRAMRFAAAYSSDLARAWHTAEIATAGTEPAVLPAPTFRERHYGAHQGLTAAEAGWTDHATFRFQMPDSTGWNTQDSKAAGGASWSGATGRISRRRWMR